MTQKFNVRCPINVGCVQACSTKSVRVCENLMCGISAVFGEPDASVARARVLAMSKLQRHRGPDWSGVYVHGACALAHERLAIVGADSGAQPILHDGCALTVNGEIYNHAELKANLGLPSSGSDCDVIIPLYRKYGPDFVHMLDGMFAFVLYDERSQTHVAARDHMGKVPLYCPPGHTAYASEMKALQHPDDVVRVFPPGHVYCSCDALLKRWYAPAWLTAPTPTTPVPLQDLRASLEAAVAKRLLTCDRDVPWGVLLSGGLDSSLIAAIACRLAPGGARSVHTFSIGAAGSSSPDVAAAAQVAAFLGTQHHSFEFTLQEGLDALSDVIYHIETFDTTTVRASTPMYLLARRVKALGIKMVLSGEGSDEVFGGYLYFHKAPNAAEFHAETVRKLQSLHLYDCLRANKSTAAWGVEARMPFLDRAFLDLAMGMNVCDKLCGECGGGQMEKSVLRRAFEGYLPEAILWRQKEQFSDGVGYGWIGALKAHAEHTMAVDDVVALSAPTKESALYRRIFNAHFLSESAGQTVPHGPSVACSTPAAIAWDAAFQRLAEASGGECSGRAVNVHQRHEAHVV